MRTNTTLHVYSGDAVSVHEQTEGHRCQWLNLAGIAFFCDDAPTADRIAQGFAELATLMRERARVPLMVSSAARKRS